MARVLLNTTFSSAYSGGTAVNSGNSSINSESESGGTEVQCAGNGSSKGCFKLKQETSILSLVNVGGCVAQARDGQAQHPCGQSQVY